MKTVSDVLDLRGFSCPIPVVETRNRVLETQPGESIEVVVETGTSRDNVSRMAHKEGCEVEVSTRETESEEEYILKITKK